MSLPSVVPAGGAAAAGAAAGTSPGTTGGPGQHSRGSAVTVRGLVKAYGPTVALAGVDLDAHPGRVLGLLGPNGAGKTTLVEICQGFRRPDGGSVRVLGAAPGSRGTRGRVGVMPQGPGAYPSARARELLHLFAGYYRDPVDPDDLLDRLGLRAAARTSWRRLSGGQQQRLSLALAVVGRPAVVFLDEPTAGLDVQARRATWDLVRDLRADGAAVVLTTHAMDEAQALADDVVIIDHGRVVAAGTPAELVGTGGRGQLRFRSRAGLDLAALRSVLRSAQHHAPPAPAGGADRDSGDRDVDVAEPTPGEYRITGALTPGALAALTGWLAARDAAADGLRTDSRSLEDVFVDLTGRDLRG